MAKEERGRRDGTGPYKDSFESIYGSGEGKRKARGESCPND
jgi:hypothetical protein